MTKNACAIILILSCLCTGSLLAQDGFIIIDELRISGNKKTKVGVLKRELPFRVGDTIMLLNLVDKLAEGERQLMNTGLFTKANITYANWEGSTGRVALQVTVEESWYIYPLPTFELADRNFNVWWKDQNRSFERVNIGMNFEHENFTGWRDELKLGFKYGYTRTFSANYEFPYINRARTLGLFVNMELARRREMNYQTVDNKQLFFRDPDNNFIQRQGTFEASLSWRPALYATHSLDVGLYAEKLDELIVETLNPDYFVNGGNEQRYFRIGYTFNLDLRDNRDYPWQGGNYNLSLYKNGLGVFDDLNGLTLEAFGERYWSPQPRWSFGVGVRGKYSIIRERQSYLQNRALGFGRQRINGYELYLIDGLDLGMFRTSARFEIIRKEFELGKWVFLEAFRYFPVRVNLSAGFDAGYVNSPFNLDANPLNERWLSGYAAGIDLILYYDLLIRAQYTRNDRGEGGVVMSFSMGM